MTKNIQNARFAQKPVRSRNKMPNVFLTIILFFFDIKNNIEKLTGGLQWRR
jgi:hypothetical protein